ncbi:efflux RND transporter permease subunit [Neptunitalea lumnitzerae]|uniref:Multidrug transporter AcrB n=1 Tax=Neptunitalea lumnitzerae TaxID=2965509 RepID=A0ABQ5MIH0_9FLAO|nr:efflux RND transporter permease subunit [Neptunitalea sp. Y10]GLB49184.1 multidrug transporter AcrB [Neptunitalea sp. Y10]
MKHKTNNIVAWAMEYKAVPLSVAFVLVIFGIYSLFMMPRNEFPDFTVRQGLVIGVYPGATSEQVEKNLTTKVEEYLFSFNEVNKEKTYSYSRDGMMYIYVEIENRVGHDASQQFWNKLKHGLLVFQQTELPKAVRGVIVNSDFGDTAAIILSIESDTRTYKDLETHVKEIEDELRQIDDMAKISHSGNLQEQIGIYIDNEKLAHYGISPGLVMQILQKQGNVVPAGSLEGEIIERPIHLDTFYTTESDLAQQIIKTDEDGNAIRLNDIAEITREYEDEDSYIRVNGAKSMIITMEMAKGRNIVQFGEEVDENLARIEQSLPDDITITRLADQPAVVDHSITHFMKEFLYALIGVIIVAILLLPFRVASVAAATIPITITATLAIMYLCGLELNTVTLAALVVVLGIVVDDPIVVIDNHVEKLDHGMSVWDAAKNSAIELFPSVFTATLAISATFLPLIFFMEGVAADFIGDFPITIMIALFLSLMISMVVVPFFNTVFIRRGLHKDEEKKKDKKSMLDRLQSFFNKQINNSMKRWKLTLFLGIGAIVVGVLLFSGLTQQLFPIIERNQLAIEISLPEGYNLDETGNVVKDVEDILANDERVVSYASFIGTSSPRFHTLYAPKLPAKNYAQILVNTIDDDATEEILEEYQEKYSDSIPGAYVRMKQLDMIVAPAPIEIRIFGEDIDSLKYASEKIETIAKTTPNTTWVRTSFNENKNGINLKIKKDEASRLGLTKEDIANAVGMNTEGLTASQIWEDDYAINIRVKTNHTNNMSVSDLERLSVIVPNLRTVVPLRQVAEISPKWDEGQLVHRNGVRCLTVRVDIKKGMVANEILPHIQKEIQNIQLPEGVKIGYGGELEMQAENEPPMALSLGLSVIIIFLILIWHFKSFKHAFLSFLTMPLSVFGAALGLMVMQYPFGFTSFIGLLALCGIVVRNGIILIDFADELRSEGQSVKEAAIHAAERRMRPIFLTSSAAAVGVIPMIMSRSTLWGPLGTVICFGLMMSMILTLFVLPVMYWLFFRKEDEHKTVNHEN